MTRRALTLSLLALAVGTGALAQDGADALSTPGGESSAHQVAREVQAFYDQTDTFQARFTQTYYHRLYQRYQRSRGELAFDKPGRMRFDYDRPNGKVIVSDGRHMTAFEPGDDGDPGQYVKAEMGSNALPAAFGFLTGQGGRILDDYRVRLLNAEDYRWSGEVLELRPRDSDPRIFRILLYVDGDSRRAGVVHRIRIDDHEGNRNHFQLRRMRFNRDIPARRFRYAPPSGSIRLQ
ncbi:MAG: outer membrane lipoprotein carrier protein LolA [Myxococcota bacterium]